MADPTSGDLHHTLYAGGTMTGKTTLARLVARQRARKKRNVVIYDPVGTQTAGGGWPEGDNVLLFDDFEEFMTWVGKNGDADLFIDEAGDHFRVQDAENHWLLRRGRHYGYEVHLISQRPKMMAPNVRNQCSKAYLFRLSTDDVREICGDMGRDAPTSELDKGDFIGVCSYSPEIVKGNVFHLLNRKKQ
jgi:DNA helicase HerA-like ATPase